MRCALYSSGWIDADQEVYRVPTVGLTGVDWRLSPGKSPLGERRGRQSKAKKVKLTLIDYDLRLLDSK